MTINLSQSHRRSDREYKPDKLQLPAYNTSNISVKETVHAEDTKIATLKTSHIFLFLCSFEAIIEVEMNIPLRLLTP